MTKCMTKSMTKQGNDKVNWHVYQGRTASQPESESADLLLERYGVLAGADRKNSRRVCRQKTKKIREAAGGRQKAFSQGSCGKMQGKKQKREKAFSQGSRDKTQGEKQKKRTIRAIRAIRAIRRPDPNGSCIRVRERKR